MSNQMKTVFFLGLLSAIIIGIGGLVGGEEGVMLAFGISLLMNIGSYWFSDKIVLSMYRAREVSRSELPWLHQIVEELANNAGLPKPKVCIVPEKAPNAFATGRNPDNAVVAVTEGILELLDRNELRGVLAHEMAHILNRDILIQSIAGVMASTISMLANMLQFSGMAGQDNSRRANPLAILVAIFVAPLAASMIQMAISRSREFIADATGARLCRDPLSLANALGQLGNASRSITMNHGDPSTAQMFIVTPLFSANTFANLFSTHPPMQERIARLRAMYEQGQFN